MRIGLDARFLSHPQPGGFKTYTTNLIGALGEIDNTNEYVLYLDRQCVLDNLPRHENFRYQVVPGRIPGLRLPFREQISLRQQIARDRLDLVHFLCNTAPVNLSQPHILTLHDTIQVSGKNNFGLRRGLAQHRQWALTAYSGWAIAKSVHCAGRIITVSEYEKEQIANELRLPPERIAVTHLAPDPVYVNVGQELRHRWKREIGERYQVDGGIILGVGYEPRKNIGLILQAFSLIASERNDLHLMIVCADHYRRRRFQQMIETLGLGRRASILGAQPPEQLKVLYNVAEVLVFPSERESFGLPPLEAIACGTPTVAMNATSVPEILQDGATLVDGHDPRIWADAIVRLHCDDSLRRDLASRGQTRASQLSWPRCAQQTLQVYQEVHQEGL